MADEPKELVWRSRADQMVWLESVWPTTPSTERQAYQKSLWDHGLQTTLAIRALGLEGLATIGLPGGEKAALLIARATQAESVWFVLNQTFKDEHQHAVKKSQTMPVQGGRTGVPLSEWADIEESCWSWAQSAAVKPVLQAFEAMPTSSQRYPGESVTEENSIYAALEDCVSRIINQAAALLDLHSKHTTSQEGGRTKADMRMRSTSGDMRTTCPHEVKLAAQERHNGRNYLDVMLDNPKHAVKPLAQTLGYGVEEEAQYMVASSKRWHTFMQRPVNPADRSLFLSKQFDSEQQIQPSVRLIYLHVMKLAAEAPVIPSNQRGPDTSPRTKWLPDKQDSSDAANAGGFEAVERDSITMEEATHFGRYLVVRRGVCAEQQAVFKVWEIADSDAQAAYQELTLEAAAYDTLEKIQGDSIPDLLGRGLLHGATMAFLALSAGQRSLADLQLTEDICNAARDALAAIHSLGQLHGDIRLENFVLQPDGKGVLPCLSPHPDGPNWGVVYLQVTGWRVVPPQGVILQCPAASAIGLSGCRSRHGQANFKQRNCSGSCVIPAYV
ncbi:hypothetical protein WJX73_005178 [Symbiochloris irregularis]|uniref:Protein kinase domain-containing protein n=1 Tax=Symbiochloris irregularis TaxID=706552 RepID=A0AAW1P5R1_9CHLO